MRMPMARRLKCYPAAKTLREWQGGLFKRYERVKEKRHMAGWQIVVASLACSIGVIVEELILDDLVFCTYNV